MAKKSFGNIDNPVNAFISDTQTDQTAPSKQKRINMPFTADNMEYLNIICKLKGMSKTKYVNSLIEKDSQANKEVVQQAKILIDKMKG